MKKFNFKRVLTVAMAICMIASMAVPTFAYDTLGTRGQNAQRTTSATIDTSLKGSIELYKIDFTNAEKDGVWNSQSYVSTGIQDDYVNDTLINNAVRAGDDDTISDLGNDQDSYGYAIKGVEFTYLKVADIVTYTENEDGAEKVMVLYGIDAGEKGTDLLTAIGLSKDNRYTLADGIEGKDSNTILYFKSDVLVKALRDALTANATTVKNALENYVGKHGGVKMPETDAHGYTSASDLALGLYLMVETKVPEMVTSTTNPFFVSLPMTTVDGNNSNLAGDTATTDSTDGGASWLYDVTLYPKNETGIPSMEKTVRESALDTGKNQAMTPDTDSDNEDNLAIKDGYKHYATASSGDTLEYQIISTLPSITSTASQISVYTFTDVLSKGLTYTKGDVKIEWFRDENCTDKITEWSQESGKFAVEYIPNQTNDNNDTTMTITMTTTGLNEINTATTVWTADGQVRRGYSDCTMRITYTAVLDSNASVNFGEVGNANAAVLQWKRSNSDYYDTLIDDSHVYSYGIDLTKLFEGENGAGDFSEVAFVIWNATDGYWVQAALNEAEGVYYVTNHLYADGNEGHDDNGSEGNDLTFGEGATHDNAVAHADLTAQEAATAANATNFIPVTSGSKANASADKGRIVIKGLEDDTYIITEVRTANGYTLLKNHIEVTITAAETDALCDVYSADVLGVVQNDPRYATVKNADNVDAVLGLGGAISDTGKKIATGSNIPQEHLEHHLLQVSATVDSNAVTMLSDDASVRNATTGNYDAVVSANALVPLTVVNTSGFDLPQTGEIGVIMMPLAGVIGICACFFFLFVLKKKEKDETAA